jgi:SAM-dependent methyltransferase
MPRQNVYTSKAENYARYRWDYAPEAIQAIYTITDLNHHSTLVDLGAGTGILTCHFSGQVGRTFALELDLEMLHWAVHGTPGRRGLLNTPDSLAAAARAEAIPLPAGCADLVTAAQAIHWFDPEPARSEIRRVLKPGGWLALVRNSSTDHEIDQALEHIATPENGVRLEEALGRPQPKPPGFYFGDENYQRLIFPFTFRQDWPAFLGGLVSASFNPNEGDPGYARFEAAAQNVFERFSQEGALETHGETECIIGRIR